MRSHDDDQLPAQFRLQSGGGEDEAGTRLHSGGPHWLPAAHREDAEAAAVGK